MGAPPGGGLPEPRHPPHQKEINLSCRSPYILGVITKQQQVMRASAPRRGTRFMDTDTESG